MPRIKPQILAKLKAWSSSAHYRSHSHLHQHKDHKSHDDVKSWLNQWTTRNPKIGLKSHRLRQKHFEFFALPLEIRNKIYTYAFTSSGTTTTSEGQIRVKTNLSRRDALHRLYIQQHKDKLNTFSPMIVNRQFAAEAKAIAWGNSNTFSFNSILSLSSFINDRFEQRVRRGKSYGRDSLSLIRRVKLDLRHVGDDRYRRDIRSVLYPTYARLNKTVMSCFSPKRLQALLERLPGVFCLEVSAWVYRKEVIMEESGEKKMVYLIHNLTRDTETRRLEVIEPDAKLTEVKFLIKNRSFEARGRRIRSGSSGVKGMVDIFAYNELKKQLIPEILRHEFLARKHHKVLMRLRKEAEDLDQALKLSAALEDSRGQQ